MKSYVVKIGTSGVINKDDVVDNLTVPRKAAEIRERYRQGDLFTVTASGSIGFGRISYGLSREYFDALKKSDSKEHISQLRQCAAHGQDLLMDFYKRAFHPFRCTQILVNYDDLKIPHDLDCIVDSIMKPQIWHPNSETTIPIINYNDPTSAKEIVKDNDDLAAKVAGIIRAHELVILTDVDGFMFGGRVIPVVTNINTEYLEAARSKDGDSNGSMYAKLFAILKYAWPSSVSARIANVKAPLSDILSGECGTYFPVPDQDGLRRAA